MTKLTQASPSIFVNLSAVSELTKLKKVIKAGNSEKLLFFLDKECSKELKSKNSAMISSMATSRA